MNAPQLLNSLAAYGVSVRAEGDALKLRPASAVPDELRGAIIELKPELLLLLQSGAAIVPEPATAPDPRPDLPGELQPDGSRVFDAGESYRRARAVGKPEYSADAPPALLEGPDREFDEHLRCWRRGQWIEPTRGTMPSYARLCARHKLKKAL